MRLGFIGTGAITEAIVTGLLETDFDLTEAVLSERNREVSARLAAKSDRVRVKADTQEIVDRADLVVLAIRPQIAQGVVSSLRFREGQRICSLVATFQAETVQRWIGTPVEIFRAIPLPSVATRVGVTAIFPGHPLGEALFGRLGTVVTAERIEEFDAFAVASSLMGTYFGFLDRVSEWMCGTGIAPDAAKSYLDGVFLGLARTSAETAAKSYSTLREEHSTPGGLNEQMFREFQASGGSDALAHALASVAERVRTARHP